MGLITLSVVAGLIVLPGLTASSISYDEGVSAAMATARGSSFLGTVVTAEPNMSLYYLVLRCLPAGHPTAAALRSPSAVAFMVAVPLVAVLGTRLVGAAAAWIGAALLATNGFVVGAAQTARSYSLLMTLSVASTLLLLRARKTRGRRQLGWLLGWGLLSGLSAYVQLLAVVTTGAQITAFGCAWPGKLRSVAVGLIPAALLWLPLAIVAKLRGAESISWIGTPSWADLPSVTATVVGGVVPLLVVVAVSCRVLGAGHLRRDPALRFLLGLTVTPVLGVYVFSVLGPTPLFLPRYLIAVAPVAALLVGAVIARERRPVLVAALAAVAVSANIAGLRGRDSHSLEDFRAAAALVSRQARSGDASAFIDPTGAAAFAVYARKTTPPSVFPAVAPGASLYDGRSGLRDIAQEVGHSLDVARSHPRVWIVESHLTTDWATTLATKFSGGLEAAGYRRREYCVFAGVSVLLLTSTPDAMGGDTSPGCQQKRGR